MTKPAHAIKNEKVDGYLNAAQVSLYIAASLVESDKITPNRRRAKQIRALIVKVEELRG